MQDNVSCETCQGLQHDDDDYNKKTDSQNSNTSAQKKENLHVNFDHLSIVSEENIDSNQNSPAISPVMLDSLEGQIIPSSISTTTTSSSLLQPNSQIPIPIGLSPLQELQSVQPPLHHFENLSYETMGPSVGMSFHIFKYSYRFYRFCSNLRSKFKKFRKK